MTERVRIAMEEFPQPGICPVSLVPGAWVFLNLRHVPVHCNLLWATREDAIGAPHGDIQLAFSSHSSHIWNGAFDPGLMEYTQQYENSLHFSPRFQSYAESLVQRLVYQYGIENKDVIEIGSGKGEFLTLLCVMGNNRGIGFDASYIPDPTSEQPDSPVTFVQDMYTERYRDHTADFICCRHVLEHIPFPRLMLTQLRRTIGDRYDTLVLFEVPNVLFMLRDLSIWDIIYEHCSYFSGRSLAYLFVACGFEIIELRDEFDGQFLSIMARPARTASDPATICPDDQYQLAVQVDLFAFRYHTKQYFWIQRLQGMIQARQKVMVWGAGSKGVMFLNTLDTQDYIEYVIDINPRKEGMYVAGSGQQIVPPAFLRNYQPDVVIIMNPIYTDEIRQIAAEYGVQCAFVTG